MRNGLHRRANWVLYHVLLFEIAGISAYDGFLVVVHRWSIASDEQNPVGQWLIAVDAGNVRLLLLSKLLGTIVAITSLLVLYRQYPIVGWIVCVALALAQALLAVYLTTF